MEMLSLTLPFPLPDAFALAILLLTWLLIGWLIESPPAKRPSVSLIMQGYRRDWMRTFVTRQPRIFDATLIDSLRQGTAFFASACMIAIGGGVAMLRNVSAIETIAADLTLPSSNSLLEIKVLLVILFLANALLKFVWAHRLFGYCSIMMAAVPNDTTDPTAFHRAAQAAEINITAAKSFNRGLRSIYFALGALGWLGGPYALVATALITGAVLYRREFASVSRRVMMDLPPPADH